MEFNEIITELDKFKDTEDFNNYVSGFVTADRVNNFLETNDGKKLLQPMLDKYHSKGMETWKTNNLENLINDEIKKRFPEADPKDVELSKLKADFEAMKQEATRKDLTNKALKVATEKNLPVEMIDFLVGNDEEITTKNLETFEKVFNEKLSAGISAKLKDNTYVPPTGNNNQTNNDPFLQGLEL